MFGRRDRRPSKYGAVAEAGFHSRKERARHRDLVILQKAGEIRGLERQTSFLLYTVDPEGNKTPIRYDRSNRRMRYRADFTYEELDATGEWKRVIEDVKGFDTPASKIKRAILATNTGIAVRVT